LTLWKRVLMVLLVTYADYGKCVGTRVSPSMGVLTRSVNSFWVS